MSSIIFVGAECQTKSLLLFLRSDYFDNRWYCKINIKSLTSFIKHVRPITHSHGSLRVL